MNNNSKHILHVIYVLGFLISFSIALPAYINSTFLKEYVDEKFIGLIFTIGSLLTLIAFAQISKVLRKIGNYKMSILLTLIYILLLVGIMMTNTGIVIIGLFTVYMVAMSLLRFSLDLFLESYSTDEETGVIRGMFFTTSNAAWVIAPSISGIILTNGDYWKIYTIATLALLPVLYIFNRHLKKFEDPKYEDVPMLKALKQIKERKNLYNIFVANFFMFFFYSWMVIYMPIYLHEHIGFDWTKIGFMFTIMLLPFVLFQLPTGWLADKKYGEKEFLVFGFVVLSLSCIAISFITSTNFWVWAGVLFTTRIGASIIQIMTETYFFKKIDKEEARLMSVFKINSPLAYIIGPIVASGFLFFMDIQYLFLVLGIIVLFGIKYSLSIEDTL